MSDWNLFEWFNHYDILVRNYVATTITKIKKVIMMGNGWTSKFVSDWLQKSYSQSCKHFINEIFEVYLDNERQLTGQLYTISMKVNHEK